ncbi:F16A2 protein, partial [Atractosteus spatula]|nr:F16A2 protein [Atractosteus spatula]
MYSTNNTGVKDTRLLYWECLQHVHILRVEGDALRGAAFSEDVTTPYVRVRSDVLKYTGVAFETAGCRCSSSTSKVLMFERLVVLHGAALAADWMTVSTGRLVRMSWLSRLNPRGPGNRASRNPVPSSPVTADPETCLMVFQNHWRQVSWILEQREASITGAADELTAVRNNTDQMLCLLAEERPSEQGGMGPILELVVSENILERLVQWHLRRGLDSDSQGALLKLFEMLIGQSQQPLLRHKPVLQPLLSLLSACADPQLGSPAVEGSLPSVLELLFHTAPQQGPTNLLIFSLLVPFIHRDGAIGQQARDALLLVMATSAGNQAVAKYIVENSYFCPVLATGLSALYSSLPRKIEVRGDDWHALRREDWIGVSSLVLFMNSLEFCNAVIQVSHPLVKSQLVDYVHNGFLVPVMGPALHKSSVEEMIASTAYLDLFLRSITETALIKTFLRFILLHRHDNDTILDTLLTRISSNSRLCMVSLSLFRTLLSFNCEDLMLQLVLRYLLPCTHVMLSQRRAIREPDLYGKSADKFLSLIPECCRFDTLPPSDREEDSTFWAKGPGSPSVESPVSKPSTPSRLAMFRRQQSGGSSEPPQSPRSGGASGALSPDSPMHQASEAPDSEMGLQREGPEATPPSLHPGPAQRVQRLPAGPEGQQPLLNGTGQSGLESVESLIEELLDRVPGDANGSGISIEAFNQELTELEETVRKRRASRAVEEPGSAKDCALNSSAHKNDEERAPSPDGDLADPKPESTGPALCTPTRAPGQPVSQPYTGPFVAVLFAKLENMLQNSLYVNVLLTGILAQLACYPQPLLRSFLLNTNMVFQPSVKSLIQVLGSVKYRIEAFAATQDNFPAMLHKARRYLVARGKLDWADSPVAVPNLRRSDTLVKSRKTSIGDLILRHTNSPTRARQAAQMAFAHVRDGGQVLHSALFRGSAASSVERQTEALRVKNAVYCAVVFCEFLKELAALAQEHAVAMPFPRSQGTEE